MNPTTSRVPMPEAADLSQELGQRLSVFLVPLLLLLDERMDVRLVRTLAATVVNLVRQRNRAVSLLLTELGELLLDGAHAPAGVKRLWRLVASPKWDAAVIDTWLAEQADAAVERALARDGVAFADLDGSVIEKPAARKLEGLCNVRSALAARFQRACGGPPPKIPTFVPGFPWLAVVVTGLRGGFSVARLRFYSVKAPAEAAERQGEAEQAIVAPFLVRWGQRVIWLVDRGFGNSPFLGGVLAEARFVARWRKDYQLGDRRTGEVAKASVLSRRMRSRWTMQIRDPERDHLWTIGVASLPVTLPEDRRPLWLVVARRTDETGKKRSTLWILTTEDASTEKGATFVLRAYTRRWQVEWAFRFAKSELGVQSIRLQLWAYREKLWRIAELAQVFLLSLLVVLDAPLLAALLHWCHRTGQQARSATVPLYRLRHALANLWNKHPPTLAWSL